MGNFLTDGRRALLEALKDDPQIASRVRSWFEFGPGLERRYGLEPAACPLLALSPALGESARTANALSDVVESARTANALSDVVQRLRLEVATAGQDAGPCEELVALVLQRLQACDESRLGLAAEGLVGVSVGTLRWRARPRRAGSRLLWTATLDVALEWKRT